MDCEAIFYVFQPWTIQYPAVYLDPVEHLSVLVFSVIA